ncbi:UNVERIFIED_CONTAM: hypothetical protein Sradi_1841300 [Sesamum radiatum]|uniref:Uncharacterized protein n=1 Tax=Sesamum radiatum TaxID=300843 RepID=A0AAW2TX59_SESRA
MRMRAAHIPKSQNRGKERRGRAEVQDTILPAPYYYHFHALLTFSPPITTAIFATTTTVNTSCNAPAIQFNCSGTRIPSQKQLGPISSPGSAKREERQWDD